MKKLLSNYINTFKGLSREVWWLALITLINRTGAMVIPFLSLYLTENLKFSFKEVGLVMTAYGTGSLIGTWLGGKLTDKLGAYKVMYTSLFISGLFFISIQLLNTFTQVCIGILLLMLIVDMFRPAMFVALSAYSKPENKTRSVTLIRLAINLGFSAGPVLGGLIITYTNYSGLFWVDGITCIMASLLLITVLNPKKAKVQDNVIVENPKSAYTDKQFILFFIAMIIFGIAFLQLFSTMPLFYENIYKLTKSEIGLLMGLNGFLIFTLEMPLIKWLESSRFSKITLMIIGALLVMLSFLILNLGNWLGILVISLVLITVGEMITFPMSNAFALSRAKRGRQGEYMALYSIAFSFSHIIGHNLGMQLVAKTGYNQTWYIMAIISLICCLLLYYLKRFIKS